MGIHPSLKVKRLPNGLDTPLPAYATDGAAGMDVCSVEAIKLYHGNTMILRTGLAVEVPSGYELQVRARSGLASRGVFVTNGPGTIDEDYRGEVMIMLSHLGTNAVQIEVGDRIAQLVMAPVCRPWSIEEVEELSPSGRGTGGLGSTGR